MPPAPVPPSKKKKKAKKGNNKKAPKVKTPWDDLDIPELEKEISNLTEQCDQAREERIQVQTEHDVVRSYYNVTQSQVELVQDQIDLKMKDIEIGKKRHGDNVMLYEQKMKYLNYAFQQKLKHAEEWRDGEMLQQQKRKEENSWMDQRRLLDLKEELKEKKNVYMEEIRVEKERLEKQLINMESALEKELQRMVKENEAREKAIQEELDIEQLVHKRVMTEQMNMQISQLGEKHREYMEKVKAEYDKKVSDNDAILSKLQKECAKVTEEMRILKEKTEFLENENRRLSSPLKELTTKVNLIKSEIKDKEKNKQSLLNTKSRRALVKNRIKQQEEQNLTLQKQYDELLEESSQISRQLRWMTSRENFDDFDMHMKTIEKCICDLETLGDRQRSDPAVKGTAGELTYDSAMDEEPTMDTQDTQDNIESSIRTAVLTAQRAFDEAMEMVKRQQILEPSSLETVDGVQPHEKI